MLLITGISKKEAGKHDCPYYTLEFRQINMLPNGQEVFTALKGKRNVFGEYKNAENEVFKAESTFELVNEGLLKVGARFAGDIAKFNTTEYMVEGNKVTSYTCVVFEGENAIKVANRHLKPLKACVVDENGLLTAEENRTNSVMTETN